MDVNDVECDSEEEDLDDENSSDMVNESEEEIEDEDIEETDTEVSPDNDEYNASIVAKNFPSKCTLMLI